MTSGGTIQILNTLTTTNAVETINAPLVIEGTGGSYTFANNSANGAGAGAGTLDFGGQISGGAAGTTTLNLAGTNTNSNTISGAIVNGSATNLAVTMNGSGTWVLGGADTYTGATTVNGGTLSLTGSIAGTTNSALVVGGGKFIYNGAAATQTMNGFTVNAGASTINNNTAHTLALGALTARNTGGTVNFNSNTTGTITTSAGFDGSGVILGPWATYTGSGTLSYATLSGSNVAAYSGASTATATGIVSATTNYSISNAGLTLAATTAFTGNTLQFAGGTSADSLTIGSGGLTLNGILSTNTNATTTTIGTSTLHAGSTGTNSELVITGNQPLTIGSVIANGNGNSVVTYSGTGALSITGTANSFTGGLYINSGTISCTNGLASTTLDAAALGNGNVTLASGATLSIQNNNTPGGDYDNPLTVVGAGTATLQDGNNGLSPTYAGAITLSGANLTLANPAGGASVYTISGGITGTGNLITSKTGNSTETTVVGPGAVNNIGTITNTSTAGTGATTFSAAIGTNVTGVFQNSATGTLILSGANTFTSGLNIQQGTVQVGNAAGVGTGLVTIGNTGTSGTLDLHGLTETIVQLATAGTAANQTITSTVTGGVLNYTGATTSTFGGVITGSTASFTSVTVNNSSAILILTGANTYTGQTSVTAGMLQIGSGSTTGTLGAGGGNVVTSSSTILAFDRSDAGLSVANAISGSGAVYQIGGGTTTLSGLNSYSGGTTINAGTLSVGSIADSPTTNNLGYGTLTFGGGTLKYTGGGISTTTRGVTLNSTGTILVTGGGSSNLTLNGTVSGGSNGLTLGAGSTGILTLGGSDSYTGTTTVNAGTLSLTGSLSSTTASVANLATLTTSSGSGSMASATLTVNAGGTVSLTAANNANSLTVGSLSLGTSSPTYVGNFATLNFVGGVSGFESLNDLGGLTANNVYVKITGAPTTGNYTLLQLPSSTTISSNFSLSPTTGGVTTQAAGRQTYTINDGATANALILNVSGAANPVVAYWNGGASSLLWNDTTNSNFVNWSSDSMGLTDAGNVPGTVTDVVLNASNTAGTVTTTLGAGLTINSLNVSQYGTNTVSSDGNTLTINANGDTNHSSDSLYTGNPAGTGILISSGANAFTFNANLLLGNSQSWTNQSANTFTVGGSVGATGASQTLTLGNASSGNTVISGQITDGTGVGLQLLVNSSGAGVVQLTNGNNSYTGGTTINAGTLRVAAISDTPGASDIGTSGTLTLGGGTLQFTATTGASTTARNVSLTNSTISTVSLSGGGNLAFNGLVSGGGTLAVSANALATTLTLGNAAEHIRRVDHQLRHGRHERQRP